MSMVTLNSLVALDCWSYVWCSCFSRQLVVFRVLVLYLGNLYSLIIALLDKVNSMNIEVSIPMGPTFAIATEWYLS